MYVGCPWPNNVCPKQPRFLLSGIQTLNNGATNFSLVNTGQLGQSLVRPARDGTSPMRSEQNFTFPRRYVQLDVYDRSIGKRDINNIRCARESITANEVSILL